MTDGSLALAVDEAAEPSAPRVPAGRRQLTLAYRASGLAAALGVLLYTMWPDFHSDFGVVDDHTVIDMMGRHSRLPVSEIPHWVISKTGEPLGRFRPVYWLGQVLESAVAGHHPALWYFDRYLLAAITLTAVYVTAVRFTGVAGAAVVSLLPFSGFQSDTWIRLGPNEAYAVPLAAAGVALLVRNVQRGAPPRRQWLGYLLLLSAAYSKENFLLVAAVAIPAAALAHGWRSLVRADVVTLAVAALLGVADVVGILVKTSLYGSVYPQSRTWTTIKAWGHYARTSGDPYQSFTTGAAVAAVLLGIYATNRRRAGLSIALALSVVLLVASQVAFYAGNPAVGHYLYPMAFAPSIVWAICFWQVRLASWWPARLVTSGLVVLAVAMALHTGLPPARAAAVQGAKDTRTFQTSFRALVAAINADGSHLVVIQPFDAGGDLERTQSLARYLANVGGYDVMIARPAQRSAGFDTVLAEVMDQWSLHGQHNILPYHPRGKCFSVLYGAIPPVCGASAPAM